MASRVELRRTVPDFEPEHAVRLQLMFREVNDRIAEVRRELAAGNAPTSFVCECSRRHCVDAVELTLEQYEEVRRRDGWFVVLAGHELETEQVAGRRGGFVIVEKIDPADGRSPTAL
jgi:hypothetical protein